MQQVLHYPRLDTVLNVEEVIKRAKDPLSKNEIDRRLPKEIMRPTLNVILNYLEESGKIAMLKEGIIWIYKEDITNKLKSKLKKSITIMWLLYTIIGDEIKIIALILEYMDHDHYNKIFSYKNK